MPGVTAPYVVLDWMVGSHRRFKVFVGNRISHLVELIAPERWRHVQGVDNPADCSSRGLYPSELVSHQLWWNGPGWLHLDPSEWPEQRVISSNSAEERDEICLHALTSVDSPVVSLERYSSFTRLKRVTAWVMRFISNCKSRNRDAGNTSPLNVMEIAATGFKLVRS